MLISVIVPVYNVEKYLHQCMDSLLAQTYPELEIILVDDGSKDSSGAICDEYAAKYSHVSVIHKANAGLGMARNTGLEHIAGEYVTFLDSDDYIDPTLIEELYRGITENGVDFCKTGFRRFNENGETTNLVRYEDRVYPGRQAAKELLPRMVGSRPDKKDSIEMCVWGTLYNAALIREHQLKFPSERELISEDLIFNIAYLQVADGACTTGAVGYNYRITPNSLTQRYRPDRFEACCRFFLHVKRTLEELGYDEETILRLHRLFFIYIKTSVRQEKKAVSGFPVGKAVANIRVMCANRCVQEAVKNYPAEKLGFKQRLFVEMLRFKAAGLLYLCCSLGLA